MHWYIYLGISALVFLGALIEAVFLQKLPYKRGRVLTPNKVLILGTFLAALLLFLPMYMEKLADPAAESTFFKALVSAVIHAITLFGFDGGYPDVAGWAFEHFAQNESLAMMYSIFSAILYIFAPVLTFGLILSFFSNLTAYLKYKFRFYQNMHVFSELNERTLAMAKSIDNKYNKKANGKYKLFRREGFVFTAAAGSEEEVYLDLREEAMELGAILLVKDIESMNFTNWWIFRFFRRSLSFYLISYDEIKKIRYARGIIRRYNQKENSLLYFSDAEESKCFLDVTLKPREMKMRVLRINDIRFLMYRYLEEQGLQLFERAEKTGDLRTIHIAVAGLGRYGSELVRALCWYCQVPGYTVDITILEENENAKSTFRAAFPSLEIGTSHTSADNMRYSITFCPSSYGTEDFATAISRLPAGTSVFVCMGKDTRNMAAANEIRRLSVQEGKAFDITTIIYNPALEALISHGIHPIGDLDSFYAVDTLTNWALIEEGLAAHMRWWNREEQAESEAAAAFYCNDYNFYSSIAKAMHASLRRKIVAYIDEKGADAAHRIYPALVDKYGVETPYLALFRKTRTAADAAALSAALGAAVDSLGEEYTGKTLAELTEQDIAALSARVAANPADFGGYTFPELLAIIRAAAEVEHVRWNAYLYSEGYVYHPIKDRAAKMHDNLVSAEELSLSVCVKDI